MTSAVIGALRVDLGLNSAQFQAGLKSAQGGLAKFGKAAVVGLAAVATAAAAAGAALGVAVKGAIDHADELGKAAQKIGLSVEALSRLEYAAKLSDVSLEGLTTGLRKFSQVMVEASQNGKSGPATVFAALGVSVKDAAGNLRSTDAVFTEVAQQFSRMEDGALKTSLAVQLFGKSGADLIPLLNSGAAGLAAMAAESDKVGKTISTRTAKAAERFNDTLTRIEEIMGGVVNKIMEAALPALQSLADTLASPEFATAAASLGSAVVTAMASIVEAATVAINKLVELRTFLNPDKATIEQRFRLANGISASSNIENRVDPNWKPGQSGFDSIGSGASFDQLSAFRTGSGTGSGGGKPFVPVIAGAGQAKAAVTDLMAGIDDAQPKIKTFAQTIGETMADAFSNMADAVMSGVNPLQALAGELLNIGKQLASSAISGFFGNLFGGGFGGGTLGTNRSLLGMPLFADGGVTNRPAIFGDAGPEAAVPLPDGRSIPVTLSGGMGGSEVLIRLDQGLLAQIVRQADANAVKIVDSRAPAAVAKTQRNRGL